MSSDQLIAIPADAESDVEVEAPSVAVSPRRGPVQVLTTIGGTYGLVVAWLIVIALFGALRPHTFLSTANLANILGSQAVIDEQMSDIPLDEARLILRENAARLYGFAL